MKLAKKNDEANKLLPEFKKIDETLDNAEFLCTKTNGTKYDFNIFALPLKFVEKIYDDKITLDEAKDDQDKFKKLIIRLENYKARKGKKKKRKKVLESAAELFRAREDIIGFFEKGSFPFKGNVFKTKGEKSEEIKEETKEEFVNNTLTFIERKSKEIINDLFKTHFNFSTPIDLTKKLFKTKDRKRNSEFLEEIKRIDGVN